MKVHELLDAPEKWTQEVGARDAAGLSLQDEADPRACQWCLVGAIRKCYVRSPSVRRVLKRVELRLEDFASAWNDAPDRTFEQVRALALELDI